MFCRRIAGFMAMVLGFLGVVACLAGAWAVWQIAARLHDVNETVFATVDRALSATEERVRSVQNRVEKSRITTAEIHQRLRAWAAREAKGRIAEHLDIEAHAEKLALHLQTADSWLETSTETIRGVQQLASLGHAFGARMDPASLEEVLEKIASVRLKLQDVEETVTKVRELAADKEDETSRLARAAKLLVRALVTISELDTRLEDVANRLGELRTEAMELKTRTSRLITWAAIACWTILVWIAAGQIALCRCGWKTVGAQSSG
jgi:chromosome segregation ATPase